MGMLRLCERRLWNVIAFVVVIYAFSGLFYLYLEKGRPQILLLPNSTWWRANTEPYNVPLLAGVNDMDRLVDLWGFQFLINNKRCDNDEFVFLLIFIHSSPTNFRKRHAIRNTWGSEGNLPEDRMRVIFLLGSVMDPYVQHQIDGENGIYHDIVQGNFLDSYRNLTYKHVMGLKWVTYFCRQARFVFKVDDDISVDIFQLKSFLKYTFGETGGVANFMMCYVIPSSLVHRSYQSKWRVSFEEYPLRKYPTYCRGMIVLMSPDVVFRLYMLSSKVPYFWIDDVHVTGTLASRIGIFHVDFTEKFPLSTVDMDTWLKNNEYGQPSLFSHPDLDSSTILAVWNKTVHYYNRTPLSHM